MLKILNVVLFLSVSHQAAAAASASCDSIFKTTETTIGTSAALAFPNGVDSRIMLASHAWETESYIPQTPTDHLFAAMLEQASQSYSVLKPSQILPIVYKQHGAGFYIERIYDWNALIGQNVVGYHTLALEYLDRNPGQPVGPAKARAKVDRLYFAGTVTAAGVVDQKLTVTLRTTTNTEVQIKYPTADTFEMFLVLAPKTSPEELLRRAFKQSSLENTVGEAFGLPTSKEDYDIAAAVVETALAVPTTWGRSAVVKILLGRSIARGESYPHYALARGKKRYSEKNLKHFVSTIYAFMESTGAMEIVSRDRRDSGPDWLINFNRTSLADEFRTIWKELRTTNGGAEFVIAEKKPRTVNELRLTKENALTGQKIVIKDDDKAFLALGVVSDQAPVIALPGRVLEIIEAPRSVKVFGSVVTLIRLRDTKTGHEDEAYWKLAMQFAELKP